MISSCGCGCNCAICQSGGCCKRQNGFNQNAGVKPFGTGFPGY